MCKAGQVNEAYLQAKTDLDSNPKGLWEQRAIGWVLYYLIKIDVEQRDYNNLLIHLDKINQLDQLSSIGNDSMIFDNIIFKLAEFVKNNIFVNQVDSPSRLSSIFSKLKNYKFNPSKGYSFLLQSVIKHDTWDELADFFDWWNLDNLSQEDYAPFVLQNGTQVMALAERALIANSKALIKLNNASSIEEFLPKMDSVMNDYPKMTYLGYFYGKLLLALGSDRDEAMKVLIPFARKKASEFWVWQLISDVYASEPEMQRACLLRAIHCCRDEKFLGKVRIKLARVYIQRGEFNKARFHADTVTRCYATNGWHIPLEIADWSRQSWFNTTSPDDSDSLNYMEMTNQVLFDGAEEAIAIVVYFDQNSHKSAIIYGKEKKMSQKLRIKVFPGNILKINYVIDTDNKPRVMEANKASLPDNLDYAKFVEGVVDKRDDKPFAFLKVGNNRYFVSPRIVNEFNVQNGETIRGLVVYDYDKKKGTWNWTCLTIKRK